MYRIGQYTGNDQMSHLICDNYNTLLIMSRFGIALGFGEKTIQQVCNENNVDTQTFLAVVNLYLNEDTCDLSAVPLDQISITSLLFYIRNSHSFFLDYKLPQIRHSLALAIDSPNNHISKMLLQYYDNYLSEVNKHMKYEEATVFPYVEGLLNKEPLSHYNINIYKEEHNDAENKLTEFKNILIKYYPTPLNNALNDVLTQIFTCADDLAQHVIIEDSLFIPAIQTLENQTTKK